MGSTSTPGCRVWQWTHLNARLPGLAVDDGLVGLEEGAGVVFVGEFDSGGEEAAAFFRGKLPVVRVVLPGAPLTGKILQVEITAKGRIFPPALFGPLSYLRHLAHSS
jgi:hypothetical protein